MSANNGRIPIKTRDDIPRAIAHLQLIAPHRVPLLRGVYHGRIGLLEVEQTTSAKLLKRWAAMVAIPGIILVGDDGDALAHGPDTWPLAERILTWARFVFVHGTGGEADHYTAAIRPPTRVDQLGRAWPAWTLQPGVREAVEAEVTRLWNWRG